MIVATSMTTSIDVSIRKKWCKNRGRRRRRREKKRGKIGAKCWSTIVRHKLFETRWHRSCDATAKENCRITWIICNPMIVINLLLNVVALKIVLLPVDCLFFSIVFESGSSIINRRRLRKSWSLKKSKKEQEEQKVKYGCIVFYLLAAHWAMI